MRSRVRPRWFGLFAAIALALVAVGQFPAAAGTPMMAAAAAESSQGACGDCTGADGGMPATACDLLCSGTLAVLPDPAGARLVTFDASAHPKARPGPTRALPPEPDPPRPAVAR